MAYVIQYGGQVPIEQRQRKRKNRVWFASICTVALVAGLFGFFPEVIEEIRHLFIPGNDAVTVAAFETLLENVQSGESISKCLTAFCQEVIYGAG